MHGGVSRKSLKALAHVDEFLHLLIRLIHFPKLGINLKCPVYGDIQFIWNHLGKGVHVSIGKIHHTPHITDNTLGSQGTEGNDLNHLFRSVFPAHVINDLLPSLEAEVDINIGHGYTLRI